MVIKLDMVVAYDEENSLMISHDPLTTWLRDVTWQIKSLIFPIPQGLGPRAVIYNEGNSPMMSHDLLTN